MSQLYEEYDVLKVLLDTYSDLEDNNRNEFVKRFSELSIAYHIATLLLELSYVTPEAAPILDQMSMLGARCVPLGE